MEFISLEKNEFGNLNLNPARCSFLLRANAHEKGTDTSFFCLLVKDTIYRISLALVRKQVQEENS